MMIEWIKGCCIKVTSTGVIMDVNGIGYGLEMPLTSLCELNESQDQVELWVHTYVREDAIRLFGFTSVDQKSVFSTLIGLNGVGPKVALAILSTLSIDTIRHAVLDQRIDVFEMVPGIGKRSAEKILVELKSKVKKLQGASFSAGSDQLTAVHGSEVVDDVRSALENFGFKSKIITPILQSILETDGNSVDFQSMMRQALVRLGPVSSEAKPPATPADSVDSSLF